jgi:hypothetical protein
VVAVVGMKRLVPGGLVGQREDHAERKRGRESFPPLRAGKDCRPTPDPFSLRWNAPIGRRKRGRESFSAFTRRKRLPTPFSLSGRLRWQSPCQASRNHQPHWPGLPRMDLFPEVRRFPPAGRLRPPAARRSTTRGSCLPCRGSVAAPRPAASGPHRRRMRCAGTPHVPRGWLGPPPPGRSLRHAVIRLFSLRLFILTAKREQAVQLRRIIEEEDWGGEKPIIYDDQEEIDSALGVGRQEYGLLSIWWD